MKVRDLEHSTYFEATHKGRQARINVAQAGIHISMKMTNMLCMIAQYHTHLK